MISTVFICFVVTIADIQADALNNEPPQARVDNSKDKDNREQLVRIVDYLNTNNQKLEQNDVNALTDEEGDQVQDVMKIAQKNYDAKITSTTNKDESALSEVRVHVIKNPEVLKEYVHGLRKRDKSTSSSSDNNSYDGSSLDLDRRKNSKDEMRRNAEFRVDKGESHEISDDKNMKSYSNADISVKMTRSKQSMKDQVTPFRADKDHRERKRGDMKTQSRDDNDADQDGYRPKQRINDETPTDTWDMLTVTVNQMSEKTDNDWDNTDATETSKKLLWGVYKNKSFKENVNTDEDRKDNDWKKHSNIDDRQQSFKERKWNADEDKQQKNSWEDNANWKTTSRRTERLNDDVKEKVVAETGQDKKWYDRTTKKKRVVNEWKVTTELGKKAEAESWQKVGMDWDKKRTTKNTKNWDDTGKFTRHSWQRNEKKKKAVSAFDKPRHVARIRDYEMAKNGFQGRTPIPFVVFTIADIQTDASDNEPPQARVDNSKDIDNREQLVKIVDYLNTNSQKREQSDANALSNEGTESDQVEDVMKIAQKNNDAKITSTTNKDDSALSEVRVHVIKNPEVLKEYVKGLRKRYKSTSSSSDDNSSDDSSLDLDRRENSKYEMRRNAEFSVDKGFRADFKKDLLAKPREQYQTTLPQRDFVPILRKACLPSRVPISNHLITARESREIIDDKNMKSYSNADESVKITRSMQSTEDQVSPFRADKYHRKRKRGDMKTQSRDDNDADEERYRPKQRITDETPTDTWSMLTATINQMSEKPDNDWDNTDATETFKRILWGVYENKSSKENVKIDEERKDNDWKKQRNIDDRQQNFKERKWNAVEDKQQKNSWEDDANWKTTSKRAERLNDGDKEKVFPKKSEDKIWYDRTPKKKRVVNEWKVTIELGRKAEEESWQKVGMDWDKKRATKDTRNWDDPGKVTRHSWQRNEKKKKPVSAFDKPRHVARIRDYEMANNGFQGLTPIPFVGKKGFNEDK